AIADQCNIVAEALQRHPLGQFDGRVQVFGVLKLRPLQQQQRPLFPGGQIVTREGVVVRTGTERRQCPVRTVSFRIGSLWLARGQGSEHHKPPLPRLRPDRCASPSDLRSFWGAALPPASYPSCRLPVARRELPSRANRVSVSALL